MMKNTLREILKGKIVIVGVGNPLRGDDGFGPALIGRLGKGGTKAVCIDAGSSPESYVGKITRENPDTILIVDATHLDRKPGEYAVLRKDEIMKSGFTTHDLSPRMFLDFLEAETQADIYMLGVQPESLSIGDEMSEPVRATLESIEKMIKEAIRA